MEDPPKKFFRLSPGREVRLRSAYFITCQEVVKDAAGEIVELRCTYDPESRGGSAPDGRSPKATLHWVSARPCRDRARSGIYNHLFSRPDPGAEGDLLLDLNPQSEEVRHRLPPGAGPRRAARGHACAVRAPRLLLRGPGHDRRPPRLQPHRHPPRHLGQGPGQGQAVVFWGRTTRWRRRGLRQSGMRHLGFAFARAVLFGAATSEAASPVDWPQFRGPRRREWPTRPRCRRGGRPPRTSPG